MDVKEQIYSNIFEDIKDNGIVRKCFELAEMFEELEDHIRTENIVNYQAVIRNCIHELDDSYSQYKIFLCSFLIYMDNNQEDIRLLLSQTDSISPFNKFFISNQLLRLSFLHPEVMNNIVYQQLYDGFYEYYHSVFKDELQYIQKENRHKDRVLVLTTQLLGERHAPTRTTFERCETLIKDMHKEVLCINTRETYNELGFMPYYKFTIGDIEESYNGYSSTDFKGTLINVYQPEYNPLVPGNLSKLLQMIYEYAPERIVVIGNRSIIGDLCANILPTVCIPLVFSELNIKHNQYVFTAGNYKVNDPAVIKGTFTFSLNPQIKKLTRAELGLPEDKFILVVVGIRLDYDIDKRFIDCIRRTFDSGTYIVFAGCFDKYQELAEHDEELRNNSSFIGYQNDILALMECCDLYVNPLRLGGGFSIAEAFCKGVPGVTLNYGDIAAAAGLEFCVKDYNTMSNTIKMLRSRKDYYNNMSEKALKRYTELTDSSKALQYIFDEMDRLNLY